MPIPVGWYCVSYSDELAIGEVRNVHYFDRDMVLFRTESGAVGLVDPACPHLGAHLGHKRPAFLLGVIWAVSLNRLAQLRLGE